MKSILWNWINLRFSEYFVRSSTGSSFNVNEPRSSVVSLLGEDVSSVICSGRLSFEITVVVVVVDDENVLALPVGVAIVDGDDDEFCVGILDDIRELLVVEASLTDGVVTDKADGIWKLVAEKPATILIGAYRRRTKDIDLIWKMKQKRSLGVNESSLRCAERVVRWLNHLQSD